LFCLTLPPSSANKYVVPSSRVGSSFGSGGGVYGYSGAGRGYNVYGGRSSSSSGFGQGLGGGLLLGYALGKPCDANVRIGNRKRNKKHFE
jgi:hypothetical protein